MVSQILNFIFSFFPIATLLYLSYRIWERKRIPSGFFHLFFALILTFISVFQPFLLVLFFEYLYDYEATIATIVFGVGLILTLFGIDKISENIAQDLRGEVRRILRFVIFLCLVFALIYYVPIYFKIQRTLIWKIGALFYGFNSILIWGIFTAIAIITGSIQELKKFAKILRILSFYFLLEPVVYLTLVAFEVLPKWLFTSRLVMSLISAGIAFYVASFTFIFAVKYIPEFVKKIEPLYSGKIKLISLRKIRRLVFTSLPFIAILVIFQTVLIKTYIEFHVRQYAEDKSVLLKNTASYIEFEIGVIFEKLHILSHDPDVARIDIPSLHSKYEKVFQELPDYIGNISRVDERGILRYTFPYDPKSIGRDVSYQKHNIRFLLRRKPQVGSVFRAVQGYDAVALLYPVFDSKGEFKGAVSCLIDIRKMFRHFSELTKAGLDEFFIASLSDSSVLFGKDLSFIGGNLYDVLNKLVRSDVKSEIKSAFDSLSYGGFALKGRHKWGRKINFAFSFARIEPLREDTETWVAVNLIDEQNLLYKFSYVFWLLGVLLTAAMIIFVYLSYVYLSSARYSFSLEDELERQALEIIESERRYRELSDNPIVGLAIYDENGFIFFNRRLCEILGYDAESFKNLKPSDIVHPDDREKFIERAMQILKGEHVQERESYKAIRKDGENVYLVCYSKGVTFEGKPAVQTVIFDATKEKIQEDIIRHLQRVESIGTFTMGMAHDFNNILQVIVASAQLMDLKISMGEVNKDELKKYIENIISISNRGAELIKRLKIFVRKEIPSAEVFKFDDVILTTAEILKTIFPKFIELEVKANTGNVKVYGSKTEIQQALLNIAVNAKDAVVEKRERGIKDYQGKIVIETCVKDVATEEAEIFKVNPGKYVCVAVVDNGIGMDEKTKSRIFEPFFTTKRPEIGTGLGMSTVFGIISSHGGFIKVDSKLGEGTRVEFYLPIVEVEETVPLVEEKVELKKEVKNAVMIISDDAGLKSKLKTIFESFGFEVLFPDDKVVAVKMLNENFDKVDLIFIDTRKQRLDLRTAVAELKILKPKAKIILLYLTPEAEDIDGVEILQNPDVELENFIEYVRISVKR